MTKTQEIHLPEALDISAFEALRALLAESEKSKTSVALNASVVERLTTPCAQLLVAFLKDTSKKQKRHIIHPSSAMASAWADFGLAALYPTHVKSSVSPPKGRREAWGLGSSDPNARSAKNNFPFEQS